MHPIQAPRVTVAALVQRDGRLLLIEENVPGELRISPPADPVLLCRGAPA